MVRIEAIEPALEFWCTHMGLVETRRHENPEGKYTLIFLAAPKDLERAKAERAPELELTYNWEGGEQPRVEGRAWGHLAYRVDDIYAMCQRLMDAGITINRPPRDGNMAFVKSPEGISIELLQEGGPQPVQEPWASMGNSGTW